MSEGICTFKYDNDPTILAASKLILEEGCMPHRVVLRGIENGKFVTHMENLVLMGDTWKHRDFYWGHYFEREDALNKAKADYAERCAKL